MIIAMAGMWMMKPPIDKIVDVVTMRHCFMTASGAVLVAFTADLWRAAHGIVVADRNDMLLNLIAFWVFKVPILKIIDVVAVADGHVAAVRAVLVSVAGVSGTGHLVLLFSRERHPRAFSPCHRLSVLGGLCHRSRLRHS